MVGFELWPLLFRDLLFGPSFDHCGAWQLQSLSRSRSLKYVEFFYVRRRGGGDLLMLLRNQVRVQCHPFSSLPAPTSFFSACSIDLVHSIALVR